MDTNELLTALRSALYDPARGPAAGDSGEVAALLLQALETDGYAVCRDFVRGFVDQPDAVFAGHGLVLQYIQTMADARDRDAQTRSKYSWGHEIPDELSITYEIDHIRRARRMGIAFNNEVYWMWLQQIHGAKPRREIVACLRRAGYQPERLDNPSPYVAMNSQTGRLVGDQEPWATMVTPLGARIGVAVDGQIGPVIRPKPAGEDGQRLLFDYPRTSPWLTPPALTRLDPIRPLAGVAAILTEARGDYLPATRAFRQDLARLAQGFTQRAARRHEHTRLRNHNSIPPTSTQKRGDVFYLDTMFGTRLRRDPLVPGGFAVSPPAWLDYGCDPQTEIPVWVLPDRVLAQWVFPMYRYPEVTLDVDTLRGGAATGKKDVRQAYIEVHSTSSPEDYPFRFRLATSTMQPAWGGANPRAVLLARIMADAGNTALVSINNAKIARHMRCQNPACGLCHGSGEIAIHGYLIPCYHADPAPTIDGVRVQGKNGSFTKDRNQESA